MLATDSASGEGEREQTETPLGKDGRSSELGGAEDAGTVLQGIIDSAPAPVFVKDSAGGYVYVNLAYEEVSGIPREEILGRTDFDVYSSEIASTYRDNDLDVMRSSSPALREEPVLLGGDQRTFAVVKFPISNEQNEVTGVCGIAVDITDRLSAEEGQGEERQGVESSESFSRLLTSLTPQEIRILDLLAEGLSDSEIAQRLTLTSGTVRHHVSHLLKKLRKQSRTQAVVEVLKYRQS